MKKPLVQGSFAAWGRTVSQKSDCVFGVAACPGQLRCKGQDFFSNITSFEEATRPGQLRSQKIVFLNKPLVRGSCAAWGKLFLRNQYFSEDATCLGQLRCLGQNSFSEISLSFEEPTCPGQLRCLGQNFSQKSVFLLKNPLVRGSCAARDRTSSQKSAFLLKNPLVRGSCAA